MRPRVPERIRDERVKIITSMLKNQTKTYAEAFLGETLDVLIERKVDDLFCGKSENYLDVKIKSDVALLQKNIYKVKIESVNSDGSVVGILV